MRKNPPIEIAKKITHVLSQYMPHDILAVMASEYEGRMESSHSKAEREFWLKSSRACKNLSSGTLKWLEQATQKVRKHKRRSVRRRR